MADKSVLGFFPCAAIQGTQHFSESGALPESPPLNGERSLAQPGLRPPCYAPTEILQLNLVTKEIQELQETQTLFRVTEDFFFGCLQKERRSHKEYKQHKEQAEISTHSSEDLHRQTDQHKTSSYPFFLQPLYFSQDSTDFVITFKLRELTPCVLPQESWDVRELTCPGFW